MVKQKATDLTKAGLVDKLAEQTDLNKRQAADALAVIRAEIINTVAGGGSATFIGFGKFTKVHRAKRSGRNPQNGASLTIKARNVPHFTAGTTFKHTVDPSIKD